MTIGHSTRSLDDLLELLETHGVKRLIDVRTIPRSRRNPQFNLESLPGALLERGIGHTHLPDLGGLRRPRPDSQNLGFKNDSFRGFADHMQTERFKLALEQLVEMARTESVAMMCAEAVPWRCHRSLISDALLARGMAVEHILDRGEPRAHRLTSFARLDGAVVTYPAKSVSAIPDLR